MIETVLTLLYLSSALALALYTVGQLVLLVQYWRLRPHNPPIPTLEAWPPVTVQLPIYNERHVAKRLLEAVAALDYPRDLLTVQVLDDSSDVTSLIITAQVQKLRRAGLCIEHIRRPKRDGFKAGALSYGLKLTPNDIIAVFDADFVPPKDFLRRTVPYMVADPHLGIVQTRWGHLNPYENGLTLAQTLSIDVHFLIEQAARNQSGWTLSFNGTGGLWRAACIESAGGWSDATLTEDLDLSYRAQLAGWHYLMLPDIVVPGEVPPQLAAYKQQQSRWAKGSTQCLARLIGPVWGSSLSLTQKIMATQNLCQYVPHPLMFILLLLTPPLMILGTISQVPLAPLGLIGLAPPLMYLVSQRTLYPDWKRRLLGFPVVMMLGAGITWNNTLAVLRAISGRGGAFQRTPKFAQSWQRSVYALSDGIGILIGEVILALYAFGGVLLGLYLEPAIVPYLALYAVSFTGMAAWGIRDRIQIARRHRQSHSLQITRIEMPEMPVTPRAAAVKSNEPQREKII